MRRFIKPFFYFVLLCSGLLFFLAFSQDEEKTQEHSKLEQFLKENQNEDGGFSSTRLERIESYYDTYYINKAKALFEQPTELPEHNLSRSELKITQAEKLENLYLIVSSTNSSLNDKQLNIIKNLFNERGLVEFQDEKDIDLARQLQATKRAQELLNKHDYKYPAINEKDIMEILNYFESEDDFVGYLEILLFIATPEVNEKLMNQYKTDIKRSVQTQLNNSSSFSEVLNKLAGLRILGEEIKMKEIPDYLKVSGKPGFSVVSEKTIDTKLTFEILEVTKDYELFLELEEYTNQYRKSNHYYTNINPVPSQPILSYMVKEISTSENEKLDDYLNQENNILVFYDGLLNKKSNCNQIREVECTLLKLNNKEEVTNNERKILEEEIINQLENNNTLLMYNYLRVSSGSSKIEFLKENKKLVEKESVNEIDRVFYDYLKGSEKNSLKERLYLTKEKIIEGENLGEPVFLSLYKISILDKYFLNTDN